MKFFAIFAIVCVLMYGVMSDSEQAGDGCETEAAPSGEVTSAEEVGTTTLAPDASCDSFESDESGESSEESDCPSELEGCFLNEPTDCEIVFNLITKFIITLQTLISNIFLSWTSIFSGSLTICKTTITSCGSALTTRWSKCLGGWKSRTWSSTYAAAIAANIVKCQAFSDSLTVKISTLQQYVQDNHTTCVSTISSSSSSCVTTNCGWATSLLGQLKFGFGIKSSFIWGAGRFFGNKIMKFLRADVWGIPSCGRSLSFNFSAILTTVQYATQNITNTSESTASCLDGCLVLIPTGTVDATSSFIAKGCLDLCVAAMTNTYVINGPMIDFAIAGVEASYTGIWAQYQVCTALKKAKAVINYGLCQASPYYAMFLSSR